MAPEIYENGRLINPIAGHDQIGYTDQSIEVQHFYSDDNSRFLEGTIRHKVKVGDYWSNEVEFNHARPTISSVNLLRYGYEIIGSGFGDEAGQVRVLERRFELAAEEVSPDNWTLEDAGRIVVSRDVPYSDGWNGIDVNHQVRVGTLTSNVRQKHHAYPSIIDEIQFDSSLIEWEVRGSHLRLHSATGVDYSIDHQRFGTRDSPWITEATSARIVVNYFLQPGQHTHNIMSNDFTVTHPEADPAMVEPFALYYGGITDDSTAVWETQLLFIIKPIPGEGIADILNLALYWKDLPNSESLLFNPLSNTGLMDRYQLQLTTSVQQRMGLHRFVASVDVQTAEKELFFLPAHQPETITLNGYGLDRNHPNSAVTRFDEEIRALPGDILAIGTAGEFDYAQVRLRCPTYVHGNIWLRIEPDEEGVLYFTVPQLEVDPPTDSGIVRTLIYVGIEVFFKVDSPLVSGMEDIRPLHDSLLPDQNWTVGLEVFTADSLNHSLIYMNE